jgi:hypothetical protein
MLSMFMRKESFVVSSRRPPRATQAADAACEMPGRATDDRCSPTPPAFRRHHDVHANDINAAERLRTGSNLHQQRPTAMMQVKMRLAFRLARSASGRGAG